MAALSKIQVSPDTPDQIFSTVLGGNPYRIRIVWNERFAYWSLSILTADESPIVTNVKMVEDYPILSQFKDRRLPTGQLYAIRENGANTRTAFDELGVNVNLYYLEPDAVIEAQAIKTISAETVTPLGTIWDSGATSWDTGSTTWDM